MEQEIEQKIFKVIDKFQGHFSIRDTKLLELIAATQGQEKLDKILTNEILLRNLTDAHLITPPTYVLNFIFEIAKTVNPKTQLDPWVTLSSPIIHGQMENGTAFLVNHEEAETIKTVFPDNKINMILGDSFIELSKLKNRFEFISSFPPFGMRREPITINGQKTSSDFASALLFKSATLLTEEGIGVFLLSSSFLFNKSVKRNLKALDISVVAVISIPSGAFAPLTSISSNLVVFSKKHTDKTFVAEITPDKRTNKIVFDTYQNRREGKAIQLGTLVDFDSFTSLQALVSEKEMQEMVKRIGYPPISLTEIALKINILKTDISDEVNNLPNSIYLPKVGNSPVVTNPSAMKIKPKKYYQIHLNTEKAIADFVANYLNSPIGKKLRESMGVGSVILQIPISQLSNCTLYLPDLQTQSELIALDSKIEQFSLRLEELKRKLWRQPRSYKMIHKDLNSINQEEKLEYWIDTLPFPISSILWHYYATKDNNKKFEHLFHFFEALSEFFSMLMLSALVQDKEFYKQECHKWIETDDKFKEWYLRSTFGGWNKLTSRLAKATRVYLADKEKKDFCKSLYGNPTEAYMNMLTSKGIVNILDEVAELRNRWKGHGGITSEEQTKQRVIKLEQHLNKLRKLIADGFEDTRIFTQMKGELDEDIFTLTGKVLVGAKSPLREKSVKSIIPLEKKKLYLTHTNQMKPVELLPFIKYVESSDACYFYTSIKHGDAWWVSYHFDKDPEITQPVDNELQKALNYLRVQQNDIQLHTPSATAARGRRG